MRKERSGAKSAYGATVAREAVKRFCPVPGQVVVDGCQARALGKTSGGVEMTSGDGDAGMQGCRICAMAALRHALSECVVVE